MSRRLLRLNSLIQLFAVMAIVVFANLLADRHFQRLDLTHDRVHSLSHGGRVLMKRLEKPLIVKVYFTQGLEAPYNNHERIFLDKLEEFRAWSEGRMELTVIDPTGDEELEAEAQRLGITPIQYSFKSDNRQELRQVYMGAALLYGERQRVMTVTQVETIEYDVARTVKLLLDADDVRTIGYLVGHQEPDLINGRGPVKKLRDRLSANYNLRQVQLGGEIGVPDDVDVLLVIGPQDAVGMKEQVQLDQYVMAGKPIAFFLSQYKPDVRTMRADPVEHGLHALVGHYGVEINRDLVVDRVSNGKMNFPVQQGNYVTLMPINYPLIPMVTQLPDNNVVVKDLDTMTFPFASSLDLPSEQEHGIEVEILARSHKDASRIKGIKLIDPRILANHDPSEEVGAWPLLVSLRGSFRSAFAGRDLPFETGPRLSESPQGTRVVVAGSADFIANNLAFMENLVDWMAEDEDLIAIRSKTVQIPTLEPVENSRRNALKAANLIGPGVLLLLVGLGRRKLRSAA